MTNLTLFAAASGSEAILTTYSDQPDHIYILCVSASAAVVHVGRLADNFFVTATFKALATIAAYFHIVWPWLAVLWLIFDVGFCCATICLGIQVIAWLRQKQMRMREKP